MELLVDGQRAVLRELTTRLPDGDTGYYQRSTTDCLRAAVATTLQLAYSCLPDFRDEVELDHWALDNGLRLWHVGPHVLTDTEWGARRWIGMSEPYEGGVRHTLVMAFGAVYFDPASGWEFEGGLRASPVERLEYGLVLEPC